MGNRALQNASQWEWASDEELSAEAAVDETAEREWQELLVWARESGALYEPDRLAVSARESSSPEGASAAEAEDEEWQWELARAKASGGDAA